MFYPLPSAPPEYLNPNYSKDRPAQSYSYSQARPNTNPAPARKNPDLNDDCMICLDNFMIKPEGDINNGVILAETECNHFFHEFCFQQFLGNSLQTKAYKDCPLCRRKVTKIDLVPVDNTGTAPTNSTHNNTTTPAQPQGPNTASVIVNTAVNGAKVVATNALTGAVAVSKFVFNFMTTESLQTTKDRLTKIEHCLAQLDIKWRTMPIMFQAEKRKMELVLSTLRSLIDNHAKRPIEAVMSSKATEKQVQNLEKYTAAFEQSIKKAQLALFADLEKLEVELATIIK